MQITKTRAFIAGILLAVIEMALYLIFGFAENSYLFQGDYIQTLILVLLLVPVVVIILYWFLQRSKPVMELVVKSIIFLVSAYALGAILSWLFLLELISSIRILH